MARFLYAEFPACELRDAVIAPVCMFAQGGSDYRGSSTHVCPGGIYTRRFLDTHLAGWDLQEPRYLDPSFVWDP